MVATDTALRREVVKELVGLAMEITDEGIAAVFVDYSGHVQLVSVHAYPAGHDYGLACAEDRLLHDHVYIDDEDWVEKLHNISTQLKKIKGESSEE